MYERTISFYTFSKTYAMTGLRLGYVAARDPQLRERMKKALFYSASNVASIVQFGGVGALEGSQASIERVPRPSSRRGAICSMRASANTPRACSPARRRRARSTHSCGSIRHGSRQTSKPLESISWAMAEYLISQGRIGCVPGVDFGANGEGYVRFCFARDRQELTGALESMRGLLCRTRRNHHLHRGAVADVTCRPRLVSSPPSRIPDPSRNATALAISGSPPQRPSGVAASTVGELFSDVPAGARIGPGAIAFTRMSSGASSSASASVRPMTAVFAT